MLRWFPILQGQYFTCHQYFVIITGIIFLTAAALLQALKVGIIYHQTKRSKMKYQVGVIDEDIESQNQIEKNTNQVKISVKDYSPQKTPLYQKDKSFCYCTIQDFQILNLASMPAILSMFSYMSSTYSFMLGSVILILLQKKKNPEYKRILLLLAGMLVFYLCGENLCISFHNELDVGIKVQGNLVNISSTFIRWLMISKVVLANQEPRNIYITLPHNASYQAFFNFHSHVDNVDAYVYVKDQGTGQSICSMKTDVNKIDYLDTLGNRNVHTALLNNLQPGMTYEIILKYNEQSEFGPYIYKSIGHEKVVMINGGDLGNTKISTQTWKSLRNESQIDVFQIGGDISYDNGMPFCYNCWDLFFVEYERLCKAHNKIIPLILTVGNHDVGIKESPNLLMTWHQGLNVRTPLYLIYFPQHQSTSIESRSTSFYQQFSGFLMISLDSEYIKSPEQQSQQLMEQFKKCTEMDCGAIIVSYHFPIFKYAGFWNNLAKSKDRITHLNSNFRKNNVSFVFENHEHGRKRMKPLDFVMNKDKSNFELLVNITKSPIYLGNGGLGVNQCSDENDKSYTKDDPESLFAMDGCSSHYWVTSIIPSNKTVQTQAQSGNGTILDFVQVSY